ncbi:sphingomyelin phosphodiesterase 3-like [Gopherus evgoodei]|uniref:sphingomyelin phosphodiesterase 3-like n=1 Tax=Gopherus evgoodei TaxID=1825980 RepID=UPI0011CF94D4|nr:sphingomyelin phosphodiesterase 3-like [Gopherus evgoodei]XP_030409940.1 sphingomyelin phosphodiesterase 3-like [Gopherus evgoodei]XP_030409941.1 sphingomyelin phosphodiesterase 3-like [Gopherus evgoodei]
MVLRESPFPNRLLSGLYSLGQYLLFPSYWAADCLLDLRETTAEQQQRRCCRCCPLRALVTGPLLLLLLILSMPSALLGLLVWLPMQAARRPFAYKHNMLSRHPEVWELPGTGKVFSFVSANVCLLPNGLAKFSNLGHMKQRAARIGQCLTQGEASASFASPRSSQFLLPTKYGATMASPPRPESHTHRPGASMVIELPDREGEAGPGEISVPFPPDVDFVCLQEVFDQRAGAHLCQLLSPFYEHIVYDVGAYGLQGCSLKVQLGAAHGQRIVGYLNCTHLHAPAADAQIRCDQLTQGLFWAQLFQDTHTQRGDVIAFDVFCGDFNFDNCSSGDELEQTHEIFRQYQDPCRVGPRQDRPWAIGTLLNYLHIHEEAVSTPEKLKRTLEQEEGRRTYLAGPILQDGRPDPSAAGSPWEGRRIDYILYREHPTTISLTTEVEKFSFITQLAGCSDHVAVGLRLLLNAAPQWQQQV